MPVFKDNADSIGRTPLVRINHLTQGLNATVLAKIEGRNPAYSVKCRIGASMIWDAEESGKLKPGMHVVEPTSGNTGIALAYVCAAKGYGGPVRQGRVSGACDKGEQRRRAGGACVGRGRRGGTAVACRGGVPRRQGRAVVW